MPDRARNANTQRRLSPSPSHRYTNVMLVDLRIVFCFHMFSTSKGMMDWAHPLISNRLSHRSRGVYFRSGFVPEGDSGTYEAFHIVACRRRLRTAALSRDQEESCLLHESVHAAEDLYRYLKRRGKLPSVCLPDEFRAFAVEALFRVLRLWMRSGLVYELPLARVRALLGNLASCILDPSFWRDCYGHRMPKKIRS